ncbi:hypothetical protein FOZ63_029245, partial [Perkinsus olseni]
MSRPPACLVVRGLLRPSGLKLSDATSGGNADILAALERVRRQRLKGDDGDNGTLKPARSRSHQSSGRAQSRTQRHHGDGSGRTSAPEYSEWLKAAVQHLPKPQTAE